MKSVELTKIKKFSLIDIPKPKITNKNDILIKVKSVGLCGSDIHYYKTGRIGNQIVKYPFIIGHEMSGIIEEVGDRASKLKKGDRVAIDPLVSCYQCDQCRLGRYHTCRNQKFLGCPGQIEGCLKEFIVLPEKCCYPIPEKMDYDTAVLCEPLSIGYYAVSFAENLKNKNIGIFGAGPIGLSVLITAKYLGANKIYTVDKLDYRLGIAKNQGAFWTGNINKTDCVKEINKLESNQLDFIFECCGEQEAVDKSLQLLKPGGKLIIIGIPEFESYTFDAHLMRRNELTVQNIRRQNEYMGKTIKAVSKNKLNPDFMITHHFKLEETEKAFQLLSNYGDNMIKAIINFD